MFELGKISKHRNIIYGISMVWIVIFHCYETFGKLLNDIPGVFSSIFRYGNMGVDVFLFLSGISMYYAMKSNSKRGGTIIQFYQKRISKIAKIYLLLSVPFFHFEYLCGRLSLIALRRQLFFIDNKVSSFWFLGVIVICYLIYPLIFQAIQSNKEYIVMILLLCYLVLLGYTEIHYGEFFGKYEILFSRIPIFVIGSLVGKAVYDNKRLNPNVYLFFIISLILRGIVFMVVNQSATLSKVYLTIFRLSLGIQAIGVVLLLCSLVEYIQNTRIYSFFGWVGTFTLEIYVCHIIIRRLLLEYNIIPNDTTQAIIWSILFLIGSLGIGFFINKLGNYIPDHLNIHSK